MPPTHDDSVPIPPRYWWLKRIMIVSAALLVALVALRLWWGWYATRLLQTEIERLRAAGEPVYPEDFDPKEEISDEENAALMLKSAVGKLHLTNVQRKAFRSVYNFDHAIITHLDELESIFTSNREAFELIHQARGLVQADWGLRIRTPAIETSLPAFGPYREFAKLLGISAEVRFLENEADAAISDLLDSFGVERFVASHPTLISQMTSWAISAITVSGVEKFILVARRDASAKAVKDCISTLSNEQHLHNGLQRAFQAERMFQFDIIKELDRGSKQISDYYGWQGSPHVSLPDGAWRYLLAPLVRMDMTRVSRITTQQLAAIVAQRYHDKVFKSINDKEPRFVDVLFHPFGDLPDSLKSSIEMYLGVLAQRRLAAVGLAVRLYRVEKGRLPETLTELVPDYLPALPLDPQAAETRTFGYLPDHAPPILYGVSDNGMDDGGQYEVEDGFVNGRALDMPFFLNGDRPVPPPQEYYEEDLSNEASEDDGEVENDNGENNDTQKKEYEP